MKKIVVLTGAGVSAESGISTFRDANGLWENHDIMEVASIEGWQRNKALVLEFYNQRRKQLNQVEPNAAHRFLAALEKKYQVSVITQNVDDLHERAGSTHVIHLHGELRKACSENDKDLVVDWYDDINIGDLASDGAQLRPFIVWFGEMVPKMEEAIEATLQADIFIVIGTSLQVYPAASLIDFVPDHKPVYVIDPQAASMNLPKNFTVIPAQATTGVFELDL
ncbi:NAD-dependent deacylase [Vaginella massiliensis]|uniref:SIR2 family NAD-dependent protein deacylase n=1 Tax=Vaginella massiliensis TaxID=1816680 RepID=UPI0008381EB5|nr:NAD-dependent deacylase [Vaginella massiliensis]